MLKKFKYLVPAALLLGTSAYAQMYVEANYSAIQIRSDINGSSIKTTPDAITGFVGYSLNERLAVEALLSTGLNSSDTTVNGATQSSPVRTKVKSYYGVFVKGNLDIAKDLKGVAKLGYIDGRSKSFSSTASSTDSASGWAYGLGLEYALSKTWYLTGGYLSLYDKGATKGESLLLGAGYKF